MPACCVLNCKNRVETGHRLFVLPSANRSGDRRQQWVELIGRKDLSLQARICEAHFSNEQFESCRHDGKKKLTPNAIPDLLKETLCEESCSGKRKRSKCVDVPVEENDLNNSIIDKENIPSTSNINNSIEDIPSDEYLDDDVLLNIAEDVTSLITKLKQRLKAALWKNRQLEKKLQQKSVTNLEKIFNKDQLQFLETNSTRGCAWSDDTISKSLNLYMACGTKGYEEIRSQNLPYPSIRTLQHRVRNLKFKPDGEFQTRRKACNFDI